MWQYLSLDNQYRDEDHDTRWGQRKGQEAQSLMVSQWPHLMSRLSASSGSGSVNSNSHTCWTIDVRIVEAEPWVSQDQRDLGRGDKFLLDLLFQIGECARVWYDEWLRPSGDCLGHQLPRDSAVVYKWFQPEGPASLCTKFPLVMESTSAGIGRDCWLMHRVPCNCMPEKTHDVCSFSFIWVVSWWLLLEDQGALKEEALAFPQIPWIGHRCWYLGLSELMCQWSSRDGVSWVDWVCMETWPIWVPIRAGSRCFCHAYMLWTSLMN